MIGHTYFWNCLNPTTQHMELLGIYFGLGALWKTTKILKNLWTKQVWDSLLWNKTVSLVRTSLFCIFFSQMWKLRLREINWFIQDQRLRKWENQNSNLSLPCSYPELVSLQKSHMIHALIQIFIVPGVLEESDPSFLKCKPPILPSITLLIISSLSYIFHLSLSTESFHNPWKYSLLILKEVEEGSPLLIL